MNSNFGPTEWVLWPMSVFSGIVMCKIVYEITGSLSSLCFKGYTRLSKSQKIEWNNRGFSTFHAIVVAAVSFYLMVLSDLFKDGSYDELIISQKSAVSDAMFGISVGYFLADLGMILWLFPALGGKEYVIHHGLSIYAISLALISGKGHFYMLMVLFSEITTPFINLRWYLDLSGMKNSKVYLWNGIAMSIGWLVARVLLFIYFFTHIYLHFDQVKTMFTLGLYSLLVVPSMLTVMNVFWFWKILKGMRKAISRKRHTQ
uniref:Transmembrane protein 56-B n=1 Tax=Anthurium amnicola TaxID=1678845 RepID=A0A1D1YNM7_9ARAE